MHRRAIIHIGLEKTGTNTIQRTLYKLRNTLLTDFGILYPDLSHNHSIDLGLAFRAKLPMYLQIREPRSRGGDPQVIQQLRERVAVRLEGAIRTRSWSTIILSGEALADFNQDEVDKLANWLRPHVDDINCIVFLRDPFDWTRSIIQEQLKGGKTLDDLLASPPRPRWERRIGRWIHALGRNGVTVVKFEDSIPNIFSSFLAAADLPLRLIAEMQYNENKNTSMSFEAALILNSMNGMYPLFRNGMIPPNRSYRNTIGAVARIPGRKFEIRDETLKKIIYDIRSDLSWLREEFDIHWYSGEIPASSDVTEPFSRDTADELARIIWNLSESRDAGRA
ncbi:hypothetical protein ACUN0C_19495 [Faunimonas sp. B44]|uniref:hypothetical protein n=1 Tax=Faunimonas sp. B44 TaxID=3461493 RepID=UPI004044F185